MNAIDISADGPPRVYVVNEPLRLDKDRGRMVRFIDISSAGEHGQLVHLLPPGELVGEPEEIVGTLREKLAGFRPCDYLLLIGDPCAIAWAAAIAADSALGELNLLRWIRKNERYEVVSTSVFAPDEENGNGGDHG